MTESQRRRLQPIGKLKRKRRSRKVRVIGSDKSQKFVPLVPGARSDIGESITSSYLDTTELKREAGEDYWVDPQLLKAELDRKQQEESRRKQFKLQETSFQPDKLKQEIVSPYKNNVIGYVVLGIGAIAVFFAQFPELLENNVALIQFPDSL